MKNEIKQANAFTLSENYYFYFQNNTHVQKHRYQPVCVGCVISFLFFLNFLNKFCFRI